MVRAKPNNPYTRAGYFCLVILILIESFLALRPMDAVKAELYKVNSPKAAAIDLPWPAFGQAALGAQGFGLLATRGEQTAAPIASVTKVITALAVLKQKPLQLNQSGPTITLGPADVASYQAYAANDGSVVPVSDGEQISERQALEALLLPSANNIADSLARWAFGSMDAYLTFTNSYVRSLGLKQTNLADASGFSPASRSSAQDLVQVAIVAMDNPVIAQIVSQKQADIPVAGTVRNTNFLLGDNGVIGIKTGNTNEAGGCFMFAAKRTVSGQELTIVGAIVGGPDLDSSMKAATNLIIASDNGFKLATPIVAGQKVGFYKTKWGSSTYAVAQAALPIIIWQDQAVTTSLSLKPLATGREAGASVGTAKATVGSRTASVPVVSQSELSKPPLSWRLTHL